MNKITKSFAILLATILLTTGCNDDKAKIIEKKDPIQHKVVKQDGIKSLEIKESKNHAKEAEKVVYKVFKDVAKIAPDGKYMILIFGTNTCPYCMKLKEDIFNDSTFQNRLKKDYSAYYLKTHENLRHKLFHEGELMDVDTKTMISIYGVQGTPTIIFTDKKGKAVIMVPGYMPKKQFLVTMDFMEQELWKNKDRKNGEVYQALKDYYIKRGVIQK